MSKWKFVLASRKFWAAVVGAAMIAVRAFVPDFPLQEDQVLGLVVVVVGYILGTALEDGLAGR
jgi:hypothetical protein